MKREVLKEKLGNFITKTDNVAFKISSSVVGGSAFAVVSAFATDDAAATTLVVTKEMAAPITNAISSNLGVLLPIGLGIMGTMIGVSLIPRIVYKFL